MSHKNGITRRWARRGIRPFAPQDQRYASTYIFGAVCPQEGRKRERAGLDPAALQPSRDKPALGPDRRIGEPGAHAVLLLDQAGWHLSGEVALPDNITPLPLPPKCPELNVMESAW